MSPSTRRFLAELAQWVLTVLGALVGVTLLVGLARAGEPTLARPLPESNEPAWSRYIAQQMGGEAEHRTATGSRVDVLTDEVAYEVDWCMSGKVYEAVGQALYYRAATNRKGGVILLMGRKPLKQEIVYYERCLVACREAGLLLRVVYVNRTEYRPLPHGAGTYQQSGVTR